jgi:sec-independent protein translocase protein TatC
MAEDPTPHEKTMPLLDHLIELRSRLMWSMGGFLIAFFVSFFVAEDIFGFLIKPLAAAMEGREGARMIFTALQEAFFTYVKVAFFAAAFICFPLFSVQVWMFIAPGLYRSERRAFLPFLIATPVLFVMGGALVYYFIMPLAWEFFLDFQTPGGAGTLPIQVEPKVDQYLSLVMRLIFAFGVGFELPVVLILLARAGLVTSEGLKRKRRYAVVGVFVVAAILTPPDVISQIGLAVPILLLYEVSIIGARMTERKRAKRDAETDDDAGTDSDGDADSEQEPDA